MTKQKTKGALLAELKAAQGKTVEFDGERKMVFNFNTLAIVQEIYPNPYEAVQALETMDLTGIKVLFHACFHSADASCELTRDDVGILLGYYSEHEPEHFKDLIGTLQKQVIDFFPALQEVKDAATEAKN